MLAAMDSPEVPDLLPLYRFSRVLTDNAVRKFTGTSRRDVLAQAQREEIPASPIPDNLSVRCPTCGSYVSISSTGEDTESRNLSYHKTLEFCALKHSFRQALWQGFVPFPAGKNVRKGNPLAAEILEIRQGPIALSSPGRYNIRVAIVGDWAPLCKVLAYLAWKARPARRRGGLESLQDCSAYERAADMKTRQMAMRGWMTVDEIEFAVAEFVETMPRG